MKNKISDLNNLLFAQLEKLSEPDLIGEALQQEMCRAESMVKVGTQITSNFKVSMEGVKLLIDGGYLQPEDAKNVLGITNGN